MDIFIEAVGGRLINTRFVRAIRIDPYDKCCFLRVTDNTDPFYLEDEDIEASLPLRLRTLMDPLTPSAVTNSGVKNSVFPEWVREQDD